MSLPQKLMVNKSMASLILSSQSTQHYRKKSHLKRSKSVKLKKGQGHVYYDSTEYHSSQIQQSNKNENLSKLSTYDEFDYIDPSFDHPINPTIQNSFYTMHETDPLMRLSTKSKSWTIFSTKKPQKQTFSYFELEDMSDSNHTETKEQPEWFYENEKKHMETFYKQLGLSFEDVITNFKQRDIVLHKRKYNDHSVPQMEHYFILLYYGIKKCSMKQLQDLWIKLYNLFQNRMKQNAYIPTIYIDFKAGENPTNVNNTFNMLFDDRFGVDLNKLKRIVKEYYYQYHPKCIQYENNNDYVMEQKMEMEPVFNNLLISEISMEKVEEEYEAISGYNPDGFWSISDGLQFPFMESNSTFLPQSPSVEAPSTPFEEEENRATIFGFVKPKTAVVAGVFGFAATFGLKFLGANKPRF